MLQAREVELKRDTYGNVHLKTDDKDLEIGSVHGAFPLSNPGRMILLRDQKGKEIDILDDIHQMEKHSRRIIKEELEKSYFMPTIRNILSDSEKLGVVTFNVMTNRGEKTFEVRNVRQNIRKVGNGRMIVKDVDGNRYQIKNAFGLPPKAQEILTQYV
ncbi:MAG: DUF1854 domain-containing protein [Spirochaetia bacterium]